LPNQETDVSVYAHTCLHFDLLLDSSTFKKNKAIRKIIRRKYVVSNNKVLSVNFVKKRKEGINKERKKRKEKKKEKKRKKRTEKKRKKKRKEKVPKTRRLEVCSPRDVLHLLMPMAGCHSSCRKLFTVREFGS
jgi:hypothetical protein